MRRYIQILVGGKAYRFLIDEALEQRLRNALKDKYQFDANNNLIIDDSDTNISYQMKQQLFASILNQIKTYDLSPDLQKKIDELGRFINAGKVNVYASDLTKLNDLIEEASEIYNHVKTNLVTSEVSKEQREAVEDSLDEIKRVAETSDFKIDGITPDESSTLEDKVKEFQTIIEEMALDEKLKEEVPISDITDAIDRIVVCSTMDDFVKQTGSDANAYNVNEAIQSKGAKIVVPPTLKLEDVVSKVLENTCKDKNTLTKVVAYIDSKATFKSETNKAFDNLRASLNVKGLNVSNINYFGDQFLNEFINICNKTGVSFEEMFADYFNGHSANRKYNSPLDRFIRQFLTYNGGDDNTRAMLEALLVKKAISRNLISSKYNNYLKEDYRSLEVNGSGFVRFNENQLNNFASSLKTTTSASGSASIQNSANISGSATFNSELGANINESTSLGLGFNNEFVQGVPDFEPRTDGSHRPGGMAPQKPKRGVLPRGVGPKKGSNNPQGINPLTGVPVGGLASGAQSLGFGVQGDVSRNLDVRADNPDLTVGFHKNGVLNQAILDDDLDQDDETLSEGTEAGLLEGSGDSASANSTTNDNDADTPHDVEGSQDDDSLDVSGDGNKEKKKKALEKIIIEFIKKHPYVLLMAGAGLLIILVFMMSLVNEGVSQQLGYYDQACDYNETNVTITNCYLNDSDKVEYETISLKDYVLGALYAYTKEETFNDETLKAAMIVLKTNALSYGNYNSSSKRVEVKSCSINNNFCDINTGCALVEEGFYSGIITYQNKIEDNNIESISGASSNYINKLESLYESISSYVFVSSSYKSSIATLSSRDALLFNENTLVEFEELASSGNSFESILSSKYASTEETDNTVYRNTIFIGDSRTQGMLISGVINDNNTVYGVGYGYNWLIGSGTFAQDKTNAINGAIEGAKAKINDNTSYNIVFWLGVNDYTYRNAATYFEAYQNLATGDFSNHEIYVVAVGPVDDNKATNVNNEGINSFNSSLEELINNSGISNLHFINLDYIVSTYDSAGLHYSSTDYKNIYNIINSNLDNTISSNKVLYNLNDYCTYYNVTENDAYWWPIGSSTATKGNIYGGEPVSTKINSYFGPRIDPLTGEANAGHGAIDISASVGTPVIATKDGTVNYINTGCTVGDYDCGGTYGNYIKIDHGEGIESLYAHLSEVLVSNGSSVVQGQIIGYSGNTGRSTGPHLHFEIRLNGTRVDPLNYVSPDNYRPVNVGLLNVDDSGTTSAENKANTCKSLLASGYSKNAVIGILINMNAEGAFRTTNLENCYEENQCCTVNGSRYGFCVHPEIKGFGSDTLYTNGVDSGAYTRDKFVNDRAGYGLIQWTSSGRKAGLYDYAKSQNKSIGSLSVQLGYLLEELKGYPVTYKYITGNYTAYDIANNFCLDFERPANKSTSCPARASKYLSEFTNYVNNGCS